MSLKFLRILMPQCYASVPAAQLITHIVPRYISLHSDKLHFLEAEVLRAVVAAKTTGGAIVAFAAITAAGAEQALTLLCILDPLLLAGRYCCRRPAAGGVGSGEP